MQKRIPGGRYIHVEIYKDNNPAQGTNRWVGEWHLPSEPWVFVVGRDGRIKARFEGSVSVAELERAVRAGPSDPRNVPPWRSSSPSSSPPAAARPSIRPRGLQELLAGFVPAEAEDLLIGLSPADDAAVYRLDDETALVFTLDFFPPLVDDPADFGTIAATNALNDVFAMGGRPLLALSIAEFPEDLPQEAVAAILSAADAQVREAGAILAGGHTLRDNEPKYGLAVVGTVHPDGVWPKSGARPGDALFLTKPLGTGLVLQAAGPDEKAAAVGWMKTLNRDWADVLRAFRPNAVTDVTGFGLLGHAFEMADRSGVQLVLESAEWPALDGALEAARAGERTGGDRRNREFAEAHVRADGVPPELLALGWDPQTAGGLLDLAPGREGRRARGRARRARPLRQAHRPRRGRRRRRSSVGTDPFEVCPCRIAYTRRRWRRRLPACARSSSPRRPSGGSPASACSRSG